MKKLTLALAASLALSVAGFAQAQAPVQQAQQTYDQAQAAVQQAQHPGQLETVQQIQQDVEKDPQAIQQAEAAPQPAQPAPAGERGGDYRYALANAKVHGHPVYDQATTAPVSEAPQVSDNAKVVGEDEVRPEGRDYKAAIVNAEKAQGKI